MLLLIILWVILCFLSFGVLSLVFILKKRAALKPWQIKIDGNYKPKISIIIPTYNESSVIRFKLENLSKLEYPAELTQVIVVDSKSKDNTIDIVRDWVTHHPNIDIQVLVERERKGKSAALNSALKHCKGDIVIVSDADCFWPCDILKKALPFLADPNVGAISGTKILLNPQQSWVTRAEDAYLRSINLMKLGESKLGSTLFFEGGFSAYKKEVLESFDPYNTGSDDCGTIIKIAENGSRAILVPEATFFTAFPATWKGRMRIKVRRSCQLVRVFTKYASLLIRKRVKSAKKVAIQNAFLYLFCPIAFILLSATTITLLLSFPYFAISFFFLLIPRVRFSFFEVVQNYLLLFVGILLLALGKKFALWGIPEDRVLLTELMLRDHMLI